MSEQAPQSQQSEDSYLQQHPDAIVDPRKAEIMAHASKGQEQALVQARTAALDAARNMGIPGYMSMSGREAKDEAVYQSQLAEAARAEADRNAGIAADVYDRLHKL